MGANRSGVDFFVLVSRLDATYSVGLAKKNV